MEIDMNAAKVMDFIKKYRYVILILLCGLVLMLMPDFSGSKTETNTVKAPTLTEAISLSNELEEILSYVDMVLVVKRIISTRSIEIQVKSLIKQN